MPENNNYYNACTRQNPATFARTRLAYEHSFSYACIFACSHEHIETWVACTEEGMLAVCLTLLSRCSKGMSDSALPYKRTPPSWLKTTAEEVEQHICKLAKKGLRPSQIGMWTDIQFVCRTACVACIRWCDALRVFKSILCS